MEKPVHILEAGPVHRVVGLIQFLGRQKPRTRICCQESRLADTGRRSSYGIPATELGSG